MRIKTLLISTAVLLLIAAVSVSAETKGRDLVTKGELKTLEGTFVIDNSEWYLVVNNQKNLIHKGPEQFIAEKKINIEQNSLIKVYGYVYQDEITPIKIVSGNNEYVFRGEDGRPLWAGRRYGKGRS
ncbi:MAG: hypothetical protein JXB50_15370 [Spirochaetes bacterium]|nr:hypothetical protein [Spirochaetota bacterium]